MLPGIMNANWAMRARRLTVMAHLALVFRNRALAVMLGAMFVALMAAGCATQDATTLIHPYNGERFQECPVALDAYRSAQDRVGGQDGDLALAMALAGGGERAANVGVG